MSITCRDEVYRLLPKAASDFESIRAIRNSYQDLALDFADAALMHIAEREGINRIFTLDRRDFTVFRTADGKPLDILPE